MTRRLLFLGKWFQGIKARFKAPSEQKEDQEPVTHEHFVEASQFMLVGVFDDKTIRHIAYAAKRVNVSYRLATGGPMPAAPKGKLPLALVREGVTQAEVSGLKDTMPAAHILQLRFRAGLNTESELSKLGVNDYLVYPISPHSLKGALYELAAAKKRRPRRQAHAQNGPAKCEWLDEAEKISSALEKSGLSRRKFGRQKAISPAKVDSLVRIAQLDDGLKTFIRDNAVWFKRGFSAVLLAVTNLPADKLPAFLRTYVERQHRGDNVTLKVAKEMIGKSSEEAG